MNYYCKFWSGHTHTIWHQLNIRLTKWVRMEKRQSTRAALRWLKQNIRINPDYFHIGNWHIHDINIFVIEQEDPYDGNLALAISRP